MPRRSRLLLPLAIVIGVAAAAGFAIFRARSPLRTFPITLLVRGAPEQRNFLFSDSPAVRFIGARRFLAVELHFEALVPYTSGRVWSSETGLPEQTFAPFPYALGSGSRCAIVRSENGERREILDFETGERRPFACDLGMDLSPTGDVVATVTTDYRTVELRSTRDGALVRTLATPERLIDEQHPLEMRFMVTPRVVFSPQGERIALRARYGRIAVADVATGRWSAAPDGEVLGLTPGGVVVSPGDGDRASGAVVVGTDGSSRPLAPSTLVDNIEALSASGEWLAYASGTFSSFKNSELVVTRPEVVVVRTDSGEVVRRVPVARADDLECLALSPDGERLAVVHSDGVVEIWALP